MAKLGFKQGYDKADEWQERLLENSQKEFGILSTGMYMAEYWKCNNLHQYESTWEDRIKHLTHIFLSSQVNEAWTRLKNLVGSEKGREACEDAEEEGNE